MKKVKFSYCSLFKCRQHFTITESPDWVMLLPPETARILLRFFQASVEGSMLLLWIKWILFVPDAKTLDKVWRTSIDTIPRRLRSRVRP